MGATRVLFNAISLAPGLGALPAVKRRIESRAVGTGGSIDARYCYSIWLRHLVLCHDAMPRPGVPRTVAELGPGDSLGMGLAALLCGAQEYRAFDVVRHVETRRNERVLDELVELFRARVPIPDDAEFPWVGPRLRSYEFPRALLPDAVLDEALSVSRVERIRHSLRNTDSSLSMVRYVVPWNAADPANSGSVDWIFSQAVLEHIDELEAAYAAMARWLRPGGWMSHQIDFTSHGFVKDWNGHWCCSDWRWKLLRGRDVWSINRQPLAVHVRLAQANGFVEVHREAVHRANGLSRARLAKRFREISDGDLGTSSAFLIHRRAC